MFKYIPFSAVLLSLCFFIFVSTAKANAPAPAHSPEAHTDLICHTSDASECYPAIFQPTEHFQRIHDDQSIPPGLHVRMDMTTGLKEARLNVPEPEGIPKADIVLIDNLPPPSNNVDDEPSSPTPDLDKEAPLPEGIYDQSTSPTYNDLSTEYPLSDPSDLTETEIFKSNIAILDHTFPSSPSTTKTLLSTLTTLTDLSHDSEYGLTLTKSPLRSQKLMNYISPSSSPAAPLEIRSASTQLLATALQNNPDALHALLSHFPTTKSEQPIETVHAALKESRVEDMIFQKRLLFLLSQLSHDTPSSNHPGQLELFVASSGLDTLLRLCDAEHTEMVDGRTIIRAKIVNFIADHIIPMLEAWPYGILIQDQPVDVDDPLLGSHSVWRKALMEMYAWARALETAMANWSHLPGGSDLEFYDSIRETYDGLRMILDGNGL